MKILIVGLNYAPEMVGIGPYTTGAAEALACGGHEVRVIAGKPYYPEWRRNPTYARPFYHRSVEGGVSITRCPHYVPARPSGARRLLHHASFALAALWPALRAAIGFRPDLVFTVAPSLIAVPVARLAARLSGARLWVHVQDFEVEAAFATGLLSAEGWVGRIAKMFEARQLANCDHVSTISPQMRAKLPEKGIPAGRISEFRNWADVTDIQPLTTPSSYRAEWGIGDRHVALYSGNIANKQGIEIIVEAARLLQHRADLVFVICGQGPNRARLEALANGLSNVLMFDLQPAQRMRDLLGLADIHLLPQIIGAADLVLPSKLANMLASGRPVVVTAEAGTGLAGEVAGCGFVTSPGDVAAFASAIEMLLDRPDLRGQFGVTARTRALRRWARAALLDGFTNMVLALRHP